MKKLDSKKDDFHKRFDMSPFQDLMKTMDSFFNQSLTQLRPFRIDLYETDSEVIVEAEMPGYSRDQIQLEIIGNQLQIEAENSVVREMKNEQTKYHNKEKSSQRVKRVVSLPVAVSEQDTTASLADGILKVTMPKSKRGRNLIVIDKDKRE